VLVHETTHVKQGPCGGLSVYSELEGWQAEYGAAYELGGIAGLQSLYGDKLPIMNQLYDRSLNGDIANLEDARSLMLQYSPDYDIRPPWPNLPVIEAVCNAAVASGKQVR
jgi:hypothetical protein